MEKSGILDEEKGSIVISAFTAAPVPHTITILDKEDNLTTSSVNEIDPLLVTWNGNDDPEDPFNWSNRKKWGVIILTSLSGLVCLMSGTMMAPALTDIGHDLSLNSETTQIALSIYTLAYAVGPLVLAPMSELYGRRPVWLLCGIIYIVFNTACGFARNSGAVIACRFLAGIGASAEFAISVPVLADTFRAEQRGRGFAWSSLISLLGTCIGPILGGVIAQHLSWRWIFWIISMLAGFNTAVGWLTFRETYAPVLLTRKARALREESGQAYYSAAEKVMPDLSTKLRTSLARPFKLLRDPIIIFCGLLQGFNFGINYIMLSTFAELWTLRYGQTVQQSGFHYISIAIGNTFASQFGGWFMDKIYRHLKRTHGAGYPEYRAPNMIPGALMIPVGLFWYGWAADKMSFWVVVDLGVVVFACGLIMMGTALGAYVVDTYQEYSASAYACSTVFKSLASFVFPIFAPQMYQALDFGWGNSLLAIVSCVIGLPTPFLIWRYGARLRAMGRCVNKVERSP